MRKLRIFTPPIRIAALLFIGSTLIAAGLRAGEIHTAAAAGDLNQVRALIEADPTLMDSKGDGGGTPLHRACRAKQVAVANYLLDKGANLSARDEYQFPPLIRACDVPGQDLALIQRLIDQGADVNAQGYNGLTPLHKAAYSGDLKVAKLLIDNGADPNTYDNYHGPVGVGSISGTVLQVAINFSPNEEMAQLLIGSGAKLNRKDSAGNTELHLAALKGYAELTRVLAGHGADVNAVNLNNRTALYYAAKHGYRRTADALIAAGARQSDIVEANYGSAPQLAATLQEGEAWLWYLGAGYAVKTKGHLLLFNPVAIDESLEAGLANGHLNPNELAGLKITLLITAPERWQVGPEAFALAKRMPGVHLVFGYPPASNSAGNLDFPSYRLAAPNESFSVDGIQVRTIPAVFGGMGYLVEVDGVKVFDAGLHAGCNEDSLVAKYRKEIDFLKPFGPVDVAILTVHDHSPLSIEVAYESYHYLLDQLSPKAVYLRGANLPEQYPKCAEVLRRRNIPVAYPEGGRAKGERFHFLRAQASAAPLTKTAECSVSGDYLGQPPPGATPEVFARGIVSTDDTNEHMAPSFSPDGNEVFWWANRWPDPGPALSMMMRRENGRWSPARPTPFSAIMPAFSPDGHRACFYAFTPGPALSQEGQSHLDIWVVEKQGDAWSEPKCLNLVDRYPELRTAFMPRLTRNGTLYFIAYTPGPRDAGIFRAELINGQYAKPELLPRGINLPPFLNWAPFIARDESYLLFSSNRTGSLDKYGDI